ncbi:MAG: protein kinase, partial [Myxococcales bacterium]|nr:protein kinase [Myxococcales bacterium]
PATEPEPTAKLCPDCGHQFSGEARFCPFDGALLEHRGKWDRSGDPLIGSVVDGRYEVLDVLGEGGMGTVYRVRHTTLGRAFALKVLRKDLAGDRELAARFIQEAKAAASVSHPSVVQITDFGALDGEQPYFVMEMLEGQSLGWLIQHGGAIPAARAVRILRQVAEALGAAHVAGIVQRDLMPDNIHVGSAAGRGSDVVKVLDFGLAKVAGASRLTRQGMVFGTPHYMSPEQASGGTVDHRADIYALGVVMYEMFTGRVPFEADSYMGVLTKHMYVAPTPPSEVVAAARELGALEDMTLRCLQKKPLQRFQSMADFIEELDRVAQVSDDGSVSLRPSEADARPLENLLADELEPPSPEELRIARGRSTESHSHVSIAIAVAGAVALVAAVIWLFTRGSDPSAESAKATASATALAETASLQPTSTPATTPATAEAAPTDDTATETAPNPVEKTAEPAKAKPTPRRAPWTQPYNPAPRPAATPTQTAKPKPQIGGSDIVDPWK